MNFDTLDLIMAKKNASEAEKAQAENTGVLISSGLIAGEALMAVILALVYGILDFQGSTFSLRNFGVENPSAWLGLLAFIGMAYFLITIPMKSVRKNS